MDNMDNKDLISAYEYADRKNINVTNVYRHLHPASSDQWQFIQVGKTKYISWDKYKDYDFPKSTGKRLSASQL